MMTVSPEATAQGLTYRYDLNTILVMTPTEQYTLMSEPELWMSTVRGGADSIKDGDSFDFSRETAEAFIESPNVSLLAKVCVVDNMFRQLPRLDKNFKSRLSTVNQLQFRNSSGYLTNDRMVDVQNDEALAEMAHHYRKVGPRLAEREGINPNRMVKDLTQMGRHFYDSSPLAGIELLRWIGTHSAKQGGSLPEEYKRLLPLAAELKAALLDMASDDDSIETYITFALGADIIGKRAELRALNPEAAQRYEAQIPRLIASADKLATFFPPEFAGAVKESFITKTFASVYGYVEHERAGQQLRDKITIGEDYELPCSLDGAEPYDLIDNLITVVEQQYDRLQDDATLVVPAVRGEQASGFQLYRLIDKLGYQTSIYLRPWGNRRFDHTLEFGRNHEGVEASIGHTMRLNPGYLPLGRPSAQVKDTISIRIDQEGHDPMVAKNTLAEERDPTREIANLALDIGSVLGPDDNFGVKVGRFLALSDTRRTHLISPERSTLNHASSAFAPSKAPEFAAAVSRMADQLKVRAKQGTQRYAGRVLARATQR